MLRFFAVTMPGLHQVVHSFSGARLMLTGILYSSSYVGGNSITCTLQLGFALMTGAQTWPQFSCQGLRSYCIFWSTGIVQSTEQGNCNRFTGRTRIFKVITANKC